MLNDIRLELDNVDHKEICWAIVHKATLWLERWYMGLLQKGVHAFSNERKPT